MPYEITHMWNLNYDKNESTYKIGTDSQAQRTDLWLLRGMREGEEWTGSWCMRTITFRMDRHQGPTVQHRELNSIPGDKP